MRSLHDVHEMNAVWGDHVCTREPLRHILIKFDTTSHHQSPFIQKKKLRSSKALLRDRSHFCLFKVKRQKPALSVGPQLSTRFTWERRQNPVSETLFLNNVQKVNNVIITYVYIVTNFQILSRILYACITSLCVLHDLPILSSLNWSYCQVTEWRGFYW
jgi:hypothetical protein